MRRSFNLMTSRQIASLTQINVHGVETQHFFDAKKNLILPSCTNNSMEYSSLATNARRYLCDIKISPCWNCNETKEPNENFFCSSCGSLQSPPKGADFFNLLSLNNSFRINIEELTRKFRSLQSLVHPDKFSNKDEIEQKNSLEWSSMINKAYKTLLNPIERGEYLLSLQGMSLPQDNSALNKEFLMEMMERNEEVEEAELENILMLEKKVQQDLEKKSKELEETFARNDFEKARFVLVQMKYFQSLEKTIKEKALNLGAIK